MAKLLLTIKAWLYNNLLTTDDTNDRIARPVMDKPAGNADVARYIKDEGSEFQLETLISIIDKSDKIKSEMLLSGRPVNSPFVNASLGIEGSFKGDSDRFDAERHKLKATIGEGAYLKKQKQSVGVKVLGMAPVGPVISNVYDVASGTNNELLTPGRILKIKGDKIKIAGEDASVGIRFINDVDSAVAAVVKQEYLATNNPKELILTIPDDLLPGTYYVEVCTQYTSGSKMLNEPRVWRFPLALSAM